MHFGRVAVDVGLDLSLPAPRPRTAGYLKLGHKGRGLIYPGAPVWADREWVGSFYPMGTRPGDYLRQYAKKFSTVEYNGSFYHLPQLTQVRQWTTQVGPEFRFCPKLPRLISHELGHGLDQALLHSYGAMCEAFGEKYGMSFMQLPDYFDVSHAPALGKFLDAWSSRWPLAIEFRHPSWFQDHMLIDPVIDQLYRSRVSAVITDTPGRRDVLHASLMYPQVMIRFVGCFPSRRDEMRLKAWADRLDTWSRAGMDALYFFVHQERHPAIPQNVDYMMRTLLEREAQGLMRPATGSEEAPADDQFLWT